MPTRETYARHCDSLSNGLCFTKRDRINFCPALPTCASNHAQALHWISDSKRVKNIDILMDTVRGGMDLKFRKTIKEEYIYIYSFTWCSIVSFFLSFTNGKLWLELVNLSSWQQSLEKRLISDWGCTLVISRLSRVVVSVLVSCVSGFIPADGVLVNVAVKMGTRLLLELRKGSPVHHPLVSSQGHWKYKHPQHAQVACNRWRNIQAIIPHSLNAPMACNRWRKIYHIPNIRQWHRKCGGNCGH